MSSDDGRPVNVVIAGVGGQGVLLASRLLCGAAVKAGLSVQAMEEHGMAQRGGAVTTQLRVSAGELHTAQIPRGRGDVLLAFEPMEGLRALPLMGTGAELLINTRQLPPPIMPGGGGSPGGTGPAGVTTSLDLAEVERLLGESRSRVHLFDATALAEEAGSGLAVNMVLIGGLAALGLLPPPLDGAALKVSLADWVAPRFRKVNTRAFERGHDVIAGSHGT